MLPLRLEGTTMTRRTIVLLVTLALGFLAAPLTVAVSSAGRMARIGVLDLGFPPKSSDWQTRWSFWQELRTLGWLEGQNMVLEYRWAEEQRHRLSMLATELVRLPVDVIVVDDTPAIRAVQQATTAIPIVMISVGDPVEMGFVADLARPGGNITGIGGMVPELSGKLLEFLKEAVPRGTRMAILVNFPGEVLQETERAAQAFGIHTHRLIVKHPDQFEPALKEAVREGAGALVILPSPLFGYHQKKLATLAVQHGLPAIYWQQPFARMGGLMAYGPSWPYLWQRAAAHTDKILKGMKPADLPVERPMQFDLVINLKTAKALGLTIPPLLLFQANEVIR
jgi:putative tryptophan/tyrosine transport system substrate-binding protein